MLRSLSEPCPKQEWSQLLTELSGLAKREIAEIHTRNFYAGNGVWRGLDSSTRAQIISTIFTWIRERKHRVALVAVDKEKFYAEFPQMTQYADVKTLWRFLALHMVLGIQREHQKQKNNKGNTVFVFDNEEREETRFTDLVMNPPEWTDTYYSKKKKQTRLDQVIDVPYWGDSQDVGLIQLADFVAYFFRRQIEIKEGKIPGRYAGEEDKVNEWFGMITDCALPKASFYPKKSRCECADLFYSFTPEYYRKL